MFRNYERYMSHGVVARAPASVRLGFRQALSGACLPGGAPVVSSGLAQGAVVTALSTEPASTVSAAGTGPAGTGRAGRGHAAADGYTARHLTVLEGLDAVRKRPGMYIGSTDGRGLAQCLGEIFDNSVDEALAGACTQIAVTLHADGSAEVQDNGRGIPVDNEPKTGLSGVELIMTRLHAGGSSAAGHIRPPADCTASALR